MKELMRSNDLVRLSWAMATLEANGIEPILLDQYTSVVEGSIGAIPRRIMVEDADLWRARIVLRDAEAAIREGSE
jgi:hypothetical protein